MPHHGREHRPGVVAHRAAHANDRNRRTSREPVAADLRDRDPKQPCDFVLVDELEWMRIARRFASRGAPCHLGTSEAAHDAATFRRPVQDRQRLRRRATQPVRRVHAGRLTRLPGGSLTPGSFRRPLTLGVPYHRAVPLRQAGSDRARGMNTTARLCYVATPNYFARAAFALPFFVARSYLACRSAGRTATYRS